MHAPVNPRTRVAVIVEERYLAQSMPSALIEPLASRGIHSDLVCAEHARFDPLSGTFTIRGARTARLPDYHAVLARTRHPAGLAMLAWAEVHGMLTINSYQATERVRNKAHMAAVLGHAGLPLAETVIARDPAALASVERKRFPLILKPIFGDNSRGLLLARTPDDLVDVEWRDELVLAQKYVSNDGFDLKLYVCGACVFAVRKPSPFNGDPAAASSQVPTTAEMRALAVRCGECFGLEVYGVDTIETSVGLVVIEVNEFPNFTGLPDAASCIADYLLARIEHRSEVRTRAHLSAAASIAA